MIDGERCLSLAQMFQDAYLKIEDLSGRYAPTVKEWKRVAGSYSFPTFSLLTGMFLRPSCRCPTLRRLVRFAVCSAAPGGAAAHRVQRGWRATLLMPLHCSPGICLPASAAQQAPSGQAEARHGLVRVLRAALLQRHRRAPQIVSAQRLCAQCLTVPQHALRFTRATGCQFRRGRCCHWRQSDARPPAPARAVVPGLVIAEHQQPAPCVTSERSSRCCWGQ